jgi:hypothetical protein
MHSMWLECLFCRCKRAKIPFKVTALDVTPVVLALNGHAVVFPFTVPVELSPEVGHRDTPYWHMRCPQDMVNGWYACHQWRMSLCRCV